MKNLITCIFMSAISTAVIMAQPQTFITPQEQIIDLEKTFAAAIKSQDPEQAGKFLSPTYFLSIGVQGIPLQIISRAQWLAGLKEYVTESFFIDDIKVNMYGNTAVAIMMYSQKAVVRGQERSGQFMLTDIWIKENSNWKIAERHSSRPEIQATVRPK